MQEKAKMKNYETLDNISLKPNQAKRTFESPFKLHFYWKKYHTLNNHLQSQFAETTLNEIAEPFDYTFAG